MRLTRAEQQQHTRESVLAAADRLFVEQGFHATSVYQIAQAAGYTKGAVYSNFDAKEDLFFAVYEERVERFVTEWEQTLSEMDPAAGLERISADTADRRNRDDGWLAVFFEFWAHVVRRPELRERFANIHARVQEPLVGAMERILEERGISLPVEARQYTVAVYAMSVGLSLERLTQPEVVDVTLAPRMLRFALGVLEDRGTARDGKDE